MSIEIFIEPINKGEELVIMLLKQEFGINDKVAKILFDNIVKPHFEQLKDTSFILAETNYVDKVYRDSYYHYYSSKLNKYKRDCIRISVFDGEITNEDFRQPNKHTELQKKYKGFYVLRPTDPRIIGRSIISPTALKSNNFLCCTTKFNTTVNSVKLIVNGFPHSSQDNETISCAETTLWAIMEYFSNHYTQYVPILPSKIIDTLTKVTSERQVPSKGLNIQQMSYALKEFGFGTRIYSRSQYGNDFESLISCYIESGIPLIIAMENRPAGSIGHALLCIGHERIKDAQIDGLSNYIFADENFKNIALAKNIKIYDFDGTNKPFVFVDDNRPVYQTAQLDNPALHYDNKWHNCKITYFIAPLYPKIYLEAFEAKNYIMRFLITGPEPLKNDSEVLIRIFLASSRSYKDSLATNETLQPDIKDILLETSMPKFIWVAELTTKELIKQKKANGLVILDSTEANIFFNKPLIIAAFQDKLIIFDEKHEKLENNILPLPNFTIYEQNLKSF